MDLPSHTPSPFTQNIQAQQENHHLFKLLVESVRDYSIFVIARDGTIITWNAGAEKIKGYKASEIIGKNYEQFFTDADRSVGRPRYLLNEAARRGSYTDEGWRVRKDGSVFWASATLTALLDSAGEVYAFAKVTHDDTERHATAEALRQSEERFRLAVSAMREHALYMLDTEGIVQSWNTGAERNKGYKAEEIIGRHFSVFFTDDDRVSGKPMRELAVAKQMGSFEEEGWRVRKDGTRFWAVIVITAVNDAQGTLRGFVKVTRDETAKHNASMHLQHALERARVAEKESHRHAEELERRVDERTGLLSVQTEKLVRTNAELEQFAFVASHDLKEPLRMITGFLDLLESRYGDQLDDRAQGYIAKVLSAAERMRELVEAVLEYSRYDAAGTGLDVVPLREVVDEALIALGPAVQESGAQVDIGPLPTIHGNRLHLARVFQNLLGNAIKFRSERPLAIRINAEAGEDEWILSVADNGIGVDERLQSRLFKLFQRLHAPGEYPGSGIGLATCKKIIEHHGGHIRLESADGNGSTVVISLPRLA